MPSVPSYGDLLWPTLRAVRELGGSGTIGEIVERVVTLERFSEDQQAVQHGDGPQSEIEYRLAWCRTYLKGMGYLHNSSRAVWAVTDDGRGADPTSVKLRHASYLGELRAARKNKSGNGSAPVGPEKDEDDAREWREVLLSAVLQIHPDAFERLAQRLLREAGFVSTTVTGRSGDGGIDGLGVYRLSLVSFPVFFQCKRYQGSVGAGAVRDFRGAMSGRGDKGLLITTSSFTSEARSEATRDGAPPIDLIDGERLCDLLKEYDLGVHTALRQIEEVTVDATFFADL